MLVSALCLAISTVAARRSAEWRLTEEIRIGPAEEGPASFATIRALTVDAAGRIYVLENQPQDIRVFSPTGTFVRHIGRPGAGPGEYQNASALAWDSLGRLLVVDEQNSRNTYFDSTGRFVESKTRPALGFYGWNWGGAILRDGRTIERLSIRESMESRTSRPGLALLDAQGRLRDTLLLPSSGNVSWEIRRGSRTTYMQVPFTAASLSAIDPRGSVWIAETSARYRIVQVSLRGDTLRRIERRATPAPVERREIDSIVEATASRLGAGPDIDRSKFPATKPFFTRLMVDDEGSLWVRVALPASTTGTAFDVFDREGRYLERATTPLRLGINVMVKGGALYADARDADDVSFVVRLRIRR